MGPITANKDSEQRGLVPGLVLGNDYLLPRQGREWQGGDSPQKIAVPEKDLITSGTVWKTWRKTHCRVMQE